jgi:CRP/FNR family cyclic AMP-dependent transcriptional regulator
LKEAIVEGLERIVREHRFFAGLNEEFCQLVCGCAKNVRFEADQYLFHEGDPADWLYLIRHGRVALAVTVPGRGGIMFQTLSAGEIVGVSWLVPPYRWTYDAKALEPTVAIAIDAACLRRKCEEDHDLGFEMMKRFVPVLVERLHATRLQILDVYGHTG